MNFEHYSWLLAIPVALALLGGLFLACARARKRLVRQFASDRLVQQLLTSYSPLRRRFKGGLILGALALVILALARPQWGYTWQESKSKGIDIMFVVDVSRSMLARDIKPNRLERSKLAILDFLDQLEGDRVGLIAFAGNAFLQCPLTLDYDAFRQSLEAINTDVISLGGTDIARAITEAEAAFSADNNYKVLVMITDGEDLEEDGIVQAQKAAANGITIYTVGVGTPEGELIPVLNRYGQTTFLRDESGEYVRTQLDADTLNEIAEVTEGFYAPLGPTGYGLEQVYEAGLKAIPQQELASRMEKVWIERFQWPLGLAIILLAWEPLIGTRRSTFRRKAQPGGSGPTATRPMAKAAMGVLFLGTLLSAGDLFASVREGENYFRQGDYAKAAEAFKAAVEADPLNAQASFNLGNTMQTLGKAEEAQAAYARALATTDLDLQADAFYNLGSLRFSEAQAKLNEADVSTVAQQGTEASRSVEQAIQQGRQVLAEASRAMLNPRQQPGAPAPSTSIIQQAQQALQFAEKAKAGGEAAVEATSAAQKVGDPVAQAWEQAANDFKSSLELKPTGDDAAHNYDYIQAQSDQLKRDLHQLKRAKQSIEAKQPELEHVIEELRKLLDQQQQNQDQQQDQQNQQQNQDQQQSQDQQQQQSQDQQQNQDQQQSGEQSPQQQNSQSSKDQQQQSGQQEQQTSEQDKQQSGEQDKQQSGEQDKQQSGEQDKQQSGEQKEQSGEQEPTAAKESDAEPSAEPSQDKTGTEGDESEMQRPQGPPRDSEEVDEMIDATQREQEAQGGEDSASANQPEQSKQDEAEPMTLSEEDAARLQQSQSQASAMAAAEGEAPEGAVPLGVMTRDDARRLLESLKRYEKKLPVSGYGRRESNRDEEGKRKDW